MNIAKSELDRVAEMLSAYKKSHGTISLSTGESFNCTCGASCTAGCSGRCDGNGSGGICWGNACRR